MSKQNQIPEVDIVVDEKAGVIREVKDERKFRSKAGHEKRVNTAIYVVLVLMSIIWLAPFVFLVFQCHFPRICFASPAGCRHRHRQDQLFQRDHPARVGFVGPYAFILVVCLHQHPGEVDSRSRILRLRPLEVSCARHGGHHAAEVAVISR